MYITFLIRETRSKTPSEAVINYDLPTKKTEKKEREKQREID